MIDHLVAELRPVFLPRFRHLLILNFPFLLLNFEALLMGNIIVEQALQTQVENPLENMLAIQVVVDVLHADVHDLHDHVRAESGDLFAWGLELMVCPMAAGLCHQIHAVPSGWSFRNSSGNWTKD